MYFAYQNGVIFNHTILKDQAIQISEAITIEMEEKNTS
jgi:hypothetical protein